MIRFFKSHLFPSSQQDFNNPSHLTTSQNQGDAFDFTRQLSTRQPQPNSPNNPNIGFIRAVLIGDKGSGKSSLLAALWPNVQPYTHNPSSFPFPSYLFTPPPSFADRDSLIITEMPSRFEEVGPVAEEIMRSDVVLLTYACSEENQVSGLEMFWIPYLNLLQVKVPILLVGSKYDVVDESKKEELDKHIGYLIKKYFNINYSIWCCTSSCSMVLEAFRDAQKYVLFPRSPLYDRELHDLTPEFVIVMKKIFAFCDQDCDGCLDEVEFRNFKDAFFIFLDLEARAIIDDFKEVLEEERLTLTYKYFVQLFLVFMHVRDFRTVWMIVKAYGFKDGLMGDCSKRQSPPNTPSSSLAPAVAEVNACLPKWSKFKRS